MSNPAEHNARQDALYRRLEREQAEYVVEDDAMRVEARKRVERAMQSPPWSYYAKSVEGSDVRRTMDLLGVPLYYVEWRGSEEAGPWFDKADAKQYILDQLVERGVCDDAYDRVLQEYFVIDSDGNEVDAGL